jgi:hypothetical protein
MQYGLILCRLLCVQYLVSAAIYSGAVARVAMLLKSIIFGN